MTASHKETVNKVNEAFAAKDIEAFLALCRDDVAWTMVGDRTAKGKQAIREWMGQMQQKAGDPPRVKPRRQIEEGSFVTEFGEMTMKENGTETPYWYSDNYRFAGDKIAELTSFVVKTNGQK
jgi:uncharacterized protein